MHPDVCYFSKGSGQNKGYQEFVYNTFVSDYFRGVRGQRHRFAQSFFAMRPRQSQFMALAGKQKSAQRQKITQRIDKFF